MGRAPAVAGAQSAHVPVQPRERAFARELRRGGVVAPALITVESVLGRVEIDLHLRMRGGELLHGRDWNGRITLAEVGHYRTLWPLGDRLGHAPAVIGDGAGQA